VSAPATAVAASRWRTSPRNLARLLAGLWLFGTGEGLLVASELGNTPWTVLAEGVSINTPMSVGVATIAISGAVLLAWLPLRQRLGLGTLLNAIVIGLAIDATLAVVPEDLPLVVRWLEMLAGIGLVALGSGFYLGAALGPGPRDGLMTGLHRLTGRPVGRVRMLIELTALTIGWLLGGTVGIGTLLFALAIGPAVALALRHMSPVPAHEL
jgi:uncharacterized membrane protein YczE